MQYHDPMVRKYTTSYSLSGELNQSRILISAGIEHKFNLITSDGASLISWDKQETIRRKDREKYWFLTEGNSFA